MLKHCTCLLLLLITFRGTAAGQDFITRGKIKFEIKVNNKLIYAEEQEENFPADEPAITLSYRDLILAESILFIKRARQVMCLQMFLNAAYLPT